MGYSREVNARAPAEGLPKRPMKSASKSVTQALEGGVSRGIASSWGASAVGAAEQTLAAPSRREHASRPKTSKRARAKARALERLLREGAADASERAGDALTFFEAFAEGLTSTCGRCGVCDDCEAADEAASGIDALQGIAQTLASVRASLASIGRTAPKRERPRCGARTRSGAPCLARVVTRPLCAHPGGEVRARCRLHGGASTGPRTADGRARSLEALARGRAVLASRRKAHEVSK